MILVEDLYKRFGDKILFSGLSMSFPAGRAGCVMGQSGCGKTTLLRLMAGLETPDAGRAACPAPVSVVFQEDRLVPTLSAAGNLRLAVGRGRDAEIAAMLSRLGLDAGSREPVMRWSGGMKRRVAIARALIAPFETLLLDEPFAGLDADSMENAARLILEKAAGKSVLLVTHDPGQAALMGARPVTLPAL